MTKTKNDGRASADSGVIDFGRGRGSVPADKKKQLIKYIDMCVRCVGLNPDNINAFKDTRVVVPFNYLKNKFGEVRCLLDANNILAREGYPDLMEKSAKLRRLIFVK